MLLKRESETHKLRVLRRKLHLAMSVKSELLAVVEVLSSVEFTIIQSCIKVVINGRIAVSLVLGRF